MTSTTTTRDPHNLSGRTTTTGEPPVTAGLGVTETEAEIANTRRGHAPSAKPTPAPDEDE